MTFLEAPTFYARIWIAGDLNTARDICRTYCMKGLCVSLWPVEYVFTMGMESGVCVSLINYPRFPSSQEEINDHAESLGIRLMEGLCQGSFTIETPSTTKFISRRADD